MRVKELIEALQKLQDDAVVEVGKEVSKNWTCYMQHAPVTDIVVIDYRDEKYKDLPEFYKKVFVHLDSD